jgi:iron complex outermembrane receptor protein
MRISKSLLLTTCSLLVVSGAATAADQSASGSVEEVVVTGSRIERAGYEAPTPVTMANRDEIQAAATPALGEYLAKMPSFGQATNAQNPNHGVSGGGAGISLVNLRNLGINRTLVLFDGRRVNVSTLTGGVDMNLVPDALVQRIDIVTGGASAAWGSDAVAGVVNIITNKEFQGVEAKVEGGVSTRGFGFTHKEEIAGGTSFHDGRGHIVGNFTYTDTPFYIYENDLPWYNPKTIVNNPAFTATNGQPRLIIAGASNYGNVGLANMTRGGLITSAGPLKNIQFVGPEGTPQPYRVNLVSGVRAFGPDADPSHMPIWSIGTPTKRYTTYVHSDYAVTDSIKATVDFNFSNAKGEFNTTYYNRVGNITVKADNAFLPESIRTIMTANGITQFSMGKTNTDFGRVETAVDRKLWRGVFGLEGEIADWKWDAYYMHGQTRTYNTSANNPYVPNYNLAIDSVVNPANGQVVCRSTLTNPTDGCVPMNIFGSGNVSQQAVDYIVNKYRTLQVIYTGLDVAAASVNGSPFSLWAGPVDIAAGIEYRRETARATADAESNLRRFFAGNFSPLPKVGVTVKEGFGEVNVPLAKDEAWARSLDLNAAVRVTDYSTSGTVTTWKAGLTYQVTDEVRVRGTRSRDIRAPTISELFTPGTFSTIVVNDPFRAENIQVFQNFAGNATLRPEIGATWTGGAVYAPQWLDGFQVSLDYYKIGITGAITSPNNQTVLDQCFAGNQAYCPLIIRNAPTAGQTIGTINRLDLLPVNAAKANVSGVDFETSYRAAIGPGEAAFRLLGTYNIEQSTDVNGLYVNNAGSVTSATANNQSGQPRIRGTANARYNWDAYMLGLEIQYIGAGKLNKDWTAADIDPESNKVDQVLYFNLQASYTFEAFGTESSFYLNVNNVFDRENPYPPVLNTNGVTPTGSYGLYDPWGRFFRGGIRVKF